MRFQQTLFVAGCFLLSAAGAAQAQEDDQDQPATADANDQAVDGSYAPFLHGPLQGAHAAVSVTGGWDAATRSMRADASGWLPVHGRFSLVLGAHLGASQAWRPSAGLAVELSAPRRQGVESRLLVAAGPHVGLVVAEGQSLGLAAGVSVLSIDGRTEAGAVALAS